MLIRIKSIHTQVRGEPRSSSTTLWGYFPKLLLFHDLPDPWDSPFQLPRENHPLPQLSRAKWLNRKGKKAMDFGSVPFEPWLHPAERRALPYHCVGACSCCYRPELSEGLGTSEGTKKTARDLSSELQELLLLPALQGETSRRLLELPCLTQHSLPGFTLPWPRARRHRSWKC